MDLDAEDQIQNRAEQNGAQSNLQCKFKCNHTHFHTMNHVTRVHLDKYCNIKTWKVCMYVIFDMFAITMDYKLGCLKIIALEISNL
jgi:hypothetical protein